MSLKRKDIVKNIKSKAHISSESGNKLLSHFLKILINKSRNNTVKISNFGTLYTRKTPERIGRNPLTLEEYIINERVKLYFKTSGKIKNLIN